MKRIILDLSHWNNVKDWDKVKIQCDGIILKCGGSDSKDGSTYKDKCFDDYYRHCKNLCIPVGCYYFGVGDTAEKGRFDAVRFYEMIKDKQFEYPVYLDFEKGVKTNKRGNTEYIKAFCEELEKRDYFVGIYTSDISGYKEMMYIDDVLPYSWWVARYGSDVKYAAKNMHMHQFTSTGKVDGIVGNVDKSYCYLDFPSIIKKRCLNGYR